ncbi:MAG: DNA repair protein RecO [Planctomycetota bacterium]|nr:DNA repair protein RecO [Planctomycetota bacterium]MDA1113314.1 DNA repair protein RecO [Planctomycetota bacterium]
MRRTTSPGIVLRRWPYSENSQVLRVLTPKFGAVSILAKGVNRLKSGQIGIYDTWALVEIKFGGKEGAEMFNLYSGKLLDRMSGLAGGTRRLVAAGILAELAELGSPPGQPSPRLFLWLHRWLEHLAEGAPVDALLCAAVLEGLEELGLQPDLEIPAGTPKGATLWFSPASGGLLVPQDGHRPDQHARRISLEDLALLQRMRATPEIALDADCGNPEHCLTILGEFLHYHLERPPKAWQLLHRQDVAPVPGP